MESKAIQELVGPDGQPFIGPHVAGTHLCLALFMDFFNSEGNFIGGKHTSTGGIFIVILNLPIPLRYSPENMFPIFTPGGHEPTTEELNHLLRPIVNYLITLYEKGISIYRDNLKIQLLTILRAMLVIIIADTPAAKKIGGFASHSHHWFCHMCRLGKTDIETNLDPESWDSLPQDYQDAIAKAWRDAPSATLRDELFDLYGIRFTELQRIPYLRMIDCIGAEPMHAIMQNTIQHHIRRTFGINEAKGEKFFDDANSEDEEGDDAEDAAGASLDSEMSSGDRVELLKGIELYSRPGVDTRALVMLSNMKVSTLVALCKNAGIPTWSLPIHNQQPKRADMVEAIALKVCQFHPEAS
jgi:hypothetical protein